MFTFLGTSSTEGEPSLRIGPTISLVEFSIVLLEGEGLFLVGRGEGEEEDGIEVNGNERVEV